MNNPADDLVRADTSQAEALLRRYYSVGKDAQSRFPSDATFDADTIRSLARREQLPLDTVQKARLFARRYTDREFESLLSLRGPSGKCLGWAHVRLLISIPNKSKRAAIQKRAVQEGWSAPHLSKVIQREIIGKKRSSGGRPMNAPRSIEQGLDQIIFRAEDFVARCESSWSEDNGWLSGGPNHSPEREGVPPVEEKIYQALSVLRKLCRRALDLSERLEERARAGGNNKGTDSGKKARP